MVNVVYISFIGFVNFVVSRIRKWKVAVTLQRDGIMKIVTDVIVVTRTMGASSRLAVTVVLLTTSVVIRSIERFSARGT